MRIILPILSIIISACVQTPQPAPTSAHLPSYAEWQQSSHPTYSAPISSASRNDSPACQAWREAKKRCEQDSVIGKSGQARLNAQLACERAIPHEKCE